MLAKLFVIAMSGLSVMSFGQENHAKVPSAPLASFPARTHRPDEKPLLNACGITEQQLELLKEIVNKTIAQSRQIVADNDDPGVIPKDRDRRLFRESMEQLNSQVGDRGVYQWIQQAKLNLAATPQAPSNDTWTDPVTGRRWLVLSPTKTTQVEGDVGCKGLGNGWRLPKSDEMRAGMGRLTTSGLKNFQLRAAYWDSWVGDASSSDKGHYKVGSHYCPFNGYSASGYDTRDNEMHPAGCGDLTNPDKIEFRALCIQ